MFVRTKKITLLLLRRDGKQGKEIYQKVWPTCSRKRREKCCQASVVLGIFNELVIEAGEPCKRGLQPKIDFKSVVITLINPSNCFFTMFGGTERYGVENTFKNYYKLWRFVQAHGRCYSCAVEYATSYLDSAHSRNNPRWTVWIKSEIGMRFTDDRPYRYDFVLLPDGRESFEVMNFSEMKVTSSAGKS